MRLSLLPLLACPKCRAELACAARQSAADGDVTEGELRCRGCGAAYPIVRGIPRFVPAENYAASFGLQWNRFRREQLDSANRTRISEDRFWSETAWERSSLRGQWVLDAGCGAGRFLEVAARAGAEAVGVDLSSAVDAARATLPLPNVHLVQASLFELPFRPGAFDACYCIGVIQHTPDPPRALRSLPPMLRAGGRFCLSMYVRGRWTLWNGKYLLRHITRHLPPRLLLWFVYAYVTLLFPFTELLFRIPKLGRVFQFCIPVADYVDNRALSLRMRYRWALLDTYDMLAPAFDSPLTHAEAEKELAAAGLSAIEHGPNPGVNLRGTRVEAAGAGK
jgi:2-polyprenyl-3-methyl-5-hydroxy-6-metoxy-1,4-benzoquinol methylase/uncharacterized protein YbaR (Trm112 family)